MVTAELETYFREREMAEIAVAAIGVHGLPATLTGDHLYSAKRHEHWFGIRVDMGTVLADDLTGYVRINEEMAKFDEIINSPETKETYGLRFAESADEIMEF